MPALPAPAPSSRRELLPGRRVPILLQPLHQTHPPAKTLFKQSQPCRSGLYPQEIQAGGARGQPLGEGTKQVQSCLLH